jgi:hypothetical protein
MSEAKSVARDLVDWRGWLEMTLIFGVLAFWWVATPGWGG